MKVLHTEEIFRRQKFSRCVRSKIFKRDDLDFPYVLKVTTFSDQKNRRICHGQVRQEKKTSPSLLPLVHQERNICPHLVVFLYVRPPKAFVENISLGYRKIRLRLDDDGSFLSTSIMISIHG